MPKFCVVEYYSVEHDVEADDWQEARQKILDDSEYQFSINISYAHREGGPDYTYIGEMTKVIELETMESHDA